MGKPQSFILQYEKALATQNWEDVAPLIAENAVVTFSNGQIHKGKAAIKIAFERNFSLIKSEKYSIKNIHWIQQNESMAAYTFDFYWAGIVNEQLIKGAGRGTSVLVFENGKWVLLVEHLGVMPK